MKTTKRAVKIKRIILAEENANDADIFTDSLTNINKQVDVEVFNNGHSLLEALNNITDFPDIVFLDLNMPMKNDFQFLEKIKETQLWKNVKIVILSSSSHPELIKTSYNLGADVPLTEPINYEDLKKTLAKLLQLDLDDLK
jgi:CheY-like chemotaxis protein